jgi:hydroxymethylbilane synthase
MAFLKELNAGCQFPGASFAEFVGGSDNLRIRGIYWDESGKRLLRAEIMQPVNVSAARAADSVSQARAAGYALAEKICEQL